MGGARKPGGREDLILILFRRHFIMDVLTGNVTGKKVSQGSRIDGTCTLAYLLLV
jgi:hypothetical protein